MTPTETKPKIKLVGSDGNVFAVMGACRKAAASAGWDKDRIDPLLAEMMDGDYNHLLATAMEHFDVS